ncbi:MAG TPA: ATP-binding protein [Acidobacteriaceae bacterium]|jgi:hypothetical protein|nr:ATP-binding protein [Acidobacteriaceae bacterium]
MQRSHAESELTKDYLQFVERRVELARLKAQALQRKSILVHGPEGVGKTRLLQEFVRSQPLALYVSNARSPHDLLLSLVSSLRQIQGPRSLPANTSAMSTSSLRGVVNRTFDVQPFLMVLDHVEGPSRIVTKIVKELNYYGRTPIFLGARSQHMEDIGALRPLCVDRSERLEVMNWPLPIALEFAHHEAERTGLRAFNLDAALESIVQSSAGNPGSVLHMVKMAHKSQYWRDDQLKFHVLYLDYRMGRR